MAVGTSVGDVSDGDRRAASKVYWTRPEISSIGSSENIGIIA
jgi:hypothetical protein